MGTTAFAAPHRLAADDVVLERLPPALLAVRSLRGVVDRGAAPVDLDQALVARGATSKSARPMPIRAHSAMRNGPRILVECTGGATPELRTTRARILRSTINSRRRSDVKAAPRCRTCYQPDASGCIRQHPAGAQESSMPGACAGSLQARADRRSADGATCVALTGSIVGVPRQRINC